jgi:hypothetical protein
VHVDKVSKHCLTPKGHSREQSGLSLQELVRVISRATKGRRSNQWRLHCQTIWRSIAKRLVLDFLACCAIVRSQALVPIATSLMTRSRICLGSYLRAFPHIGSHKNRNSQGIGFAGVSGAIFKKALKCTDAKLLVGARSWRCRSLQSERAFVIPFIISVIFIIADT